MLRASIKTRLLSEGRSLSKIKMCSLCRRLRYFLSPCFFFFLKPKFLLRVLLQCDAVKTMTHYAYAIPTRRFIIYGRETPIHCSLLLNVHETLRPYGNSQFVFIVQQFLETTHTRVLTFHRREVNHHVLIPSKYRRLKRLNQKRLRLKCEKGPPKRNGSLIWSAH